MAPDLKPTNPKDACGIKKAPMSCVPLQVLGELGLAMLEGAAKYGRHNFRVIGVRASVYFDAACRHLFAWWEGEDLDPDSGMPHIVKAMACLAVLRDAQIQGQYTDDRPPPSPDGWIKELNDKAAKLLERYPEPVPPYTAASIAHDASEQAYREQLHRIQARHEAGMSDAERVIAACQDVAHFKGTSNSPGETSATDQELAANVAYLKALPESQIPEEHPAT